MGSTIAAIEAYRAAKECDDLLGKALAALEGADAHREQAARELVRRALAFVGKRREWCPTEARSAVREAADSFGRAYQTERTGAACPCAAGGGCVCIATRRDDE